MGSSRNSAVGSAASSTPTFTRFFCPPEMPLEHNPGSSAKGQQLLPAWDGSKTALAGSEPGFGGENLAIKALYRNPKPGTGRAPTGTTQRFPTALLRTQHFIFWAAHRFSTVPTKQSCTAPSPSISHSPSTWK